MKMLISRYIDTGKQFIGNGFLLSEFDNAIKYEFRTLELSWNDNKTNQSCIPKGRYKVIKRKSSKYGNHFHVTNVNGRKYILIHNGNYYTDIRGCILVGNDLRYLNNDEEIDVINSKRTLKKLHKLLPKEFELTIMEV